MPTTYFHARTRCTVAYGYGVHTYIDNLGVTVTHTNLSLDVIREREAIIDSAVRLASRRPALGRVRTLRHAHIETTPAYVPCPISSTLPSCDCAAISGALPLQTPRRPCSVVQRRVHYFALHAGPALPERQDGKGTRRLRFGRTQTRRRMGALPAP
jgi:hypothetical protein